MKLGFVPSPVQRHFLAAFRALQREQMAFRAGMLSRARAGESLPAAEREGRLRELHA